MCRDCEVSDPPPVVRQQHQDEQEAIGHRWDNEEIGRHDLTDVIPQERRSVPKIAWDTAGAPVAAG
jgi:hypothetical protein